MLSNASTQEPAYLAQLRGIGQRLDTVDHRLAQLVVHHEGQPDVVAALAPAWQEWPGLAGCFVYHVPRRAGDTGPYLAICEAAPGVLSEGVSLDESRLIALLEGSAITNGQPLRVGEVLWIAPGQPLDWRAGPQGFLCAIRYDVPPHDIDPTLLPPAF